MPTPQVPSFDRSSGRPDRILLVDTGNHRIEEYFPSTKSYRTWAS